MAAQDGVINIVVTAFGIGIESLDPAQMCRSSVVSEVPELELNVDERNEYGQRHALTGRETALNQLHRAPTSMIHD